MKEKDIENLILNWLLFVPNSMWWKNQSTGVFDPIKKIYRLSHNRFHLNGVSDILGVCKGRFVGIEVKAAKGRISTNQLKFIDRITTHGGLAFIARSIDEVRDRLIKEGLYEQKTTNCH